MERSDGEEADHVVNHLEAGAGEGEEEDGVEGAQGHQLTSTWRLPWFYKLTVSFSKPHGPQSPLVF